MWKTCAWVNVINLERKELLPSRNEYNFETDGMLRKWRLDVEKSKRCFQADQSILESI
jgi:hypothetical protein